MSPPDYAERRRRFGRALYEALIAHDMTQEELGEKIDKEQATISSWINGKSAPRQVELGFAVEKAIGVSPGQLTRHLGYLPPEAYDSPASVEATILGDDDLSPAEKDMLIESYRAALRRKGKRLGRRSKIAD